MDKVVRKIKEQLLVIIFVGFVVFVFYAMFTFRGEDVSKNIESPTVTIGNTNISVMVADDEDEKVQGLSGVESLDKNTGMLFIYDQPSYYTFWMKGMLFPLDFIWINNNTVVDITTYVQNPSYDDEPPQTITPNYPALMILEVPAGYVDEKGIGIGDPVTVTL